MFTQHGWPENVSLITFVFFYYWLRWRHNISCYFQYFFEFFIYEFFHT